MGPHWIPFSFSFQGLNFGCFRYQWNEWELRREALAVAAEGEKRSEAVPCVDWHAIFMTNIKTGSMKKTAGKSGT